MAIDVSGVCTYCGETFPTPVELHHSEADCPVFRKPYATSDGSDDPVRCSAEADDDAILARLPTPPEDSEWGVTNLGGGWTITLTTRKRFHGPSPDSALDAALAEYEPA